MRILVINGPNINMLGIREPEIYGSMTYPKLLDYIREQTSGLNVELTFYQSNSEGDIVSAIQGAYGNMDAIVINPAAYTHTSIALLDALKAVALPAAEVHISDVSAREPFRQISYVGYYCEKRVIGHGYDGYVEAIKYMAERYGKA